VLSTRAAAVLLLAFCAALLAGCSERASRITGNERLLRGSIGLGTTYVSDTLIDQDTHLSPTLTTLRGATLIAGQTGSYEARSLFRTTAWSLPESTAFVDTVRFRINYDARVNQIGDPTLGLHLAGAAWDSVTVTWPGPPLGTLLGSSSFGPGSFTVQLGAASITQVRSWSRDPLFPGLEMSIESGSGILGFLAGTGRIEIVYHTLVDPTLKTLITRFPTDLTVYSPDTPASGAADSLVLGGLFQSEVLLRAPVAPSPAGFSINGATFVAYVRSGAFPDTISELRVYRVALPWTEGSPTDSVNSAAISILTSYNLRAPGDSIVIPIPIPVALAWSQSPATNYGILLRVTNSYFAPEILLDSRESIRPPTLRVTRTTPPPGRF
jgi:hypothetical protein